MKKETLNRFDRIVAILIHLQSGRVVKAQDLADRFEVSLRTIYRDIRSLEASGVPVTAEPGMGYSLLEGYRLPPVMFTREEAASFVAAEKLMQKFSDKTLGSYYEAAMYKVKSVLKGNAKELVAALETQVWINASQEHFNEQVPDALHILLNSIAEKTQVRLQYQAHYSDNATTRNIEPVGLFNESNFWHILAFCHLRQEYRQFRTDRILEIKKTKLPFTREHGPMEIYRQQTDDREKIKVVIRVDKDTAKYIRFGRKYYGYVSEKILPDCVEMTFMTCDLQEGLPRWFLMFGDHAEIIEPVQLKERVAELIEKTQKNLGIRSESLVY